VGVIPTLGHLKPAPDRRVRYDPHAANSLPLRERPPIPQHAEPRPIILPEPDEDHPFNEGGYWPLGPMVPPGRKMRALYEVRCSTTRVASLLIEPLKPLGPFFGFLCTIAVCLAILWRLAYSFWQEYPYLALVAGLAGCLVAYAGVELLRKARDDGRPAAEEETMEPHDHSDRRAAPARRGGESIQSRRRP
jgi:hypothetical protein